MTSTDPQHRPKTLARSPAPRFHAATREAWFLLWKAYSLFVAAFRTAAAKLRASDRASPFPAGPLVREGLKLIAGGSEDRPAG